MQSLGVPAVYSNLVGTMTCRGVAVNGDGSVLTGDFYHSSTGTRGWRWTESGMVDIGSLPNAVSCSPIGISSDGQAIAGGASIPWFTSSVSRGWRWTSGGMQDIGTLSDASRPYTVVPYAMSADGLCIVGTGSNMGTPANPYAFRWSLASGMQALGSLPGANSVTPFAVNADGSVIVGSCGYSAAPTRPFRWSPSGTVDIGGTWLTATPRAVNANGRVIAGEGIRTVGATSAAVFWTEQTGMVDLRDYLSSMGVNVGPWSRLISVSGISADGTWMVGDGISNNGTRAFLVHLSLPCPSYADIAGLGGVPGGDGQVTVDDIVYYLAQFFAGNAAVADLTSLGGTGNPDGLLSTDDLIAFLAAFFAGCP